ncbi:beta-L-arabinofuranosidase domain-containing protein [Lentisphaerota bacterium WC36G]|nr:glycoside hydrolase family 127 protein [Lentisphaerae bacterium WC36]
MFKSEGWFGNLKTKNKNKSWWTFEQTGYYIDGTVRMGAILDDNGVEQRGIKAINNAVERSKNDSRGYYYLINKDIEKNMFTDYFYPLAVSGGSQSGHYWALACFNRGVLALYEQTKDKKYLDMLEKMYVNFPDFNRHYPNKPLCSKELHINRRLANIENMFEVYRYTGNKKILNKALRLLKYYEQAVTKSWVEEKDFSRTDLIHGVSFNEIAKQFATAYAWTGNKNYLTASVNAFERLEKCHKLPIGVNSSNEYLNGIGAFHAAESCNSADHLWSNVKLIEATGDSIYADRVEKLFFNAGFGAVNEDFSKYAYIQTANWVPEMKIDGCKGAVHTQMKNFHRPACCAGNLIRIMPNFISSMVMQNASGPAILLYGPMEAKAYSANGNYVTLTTKTNYPFNDKITISVEPSIDNDMFNLALRIPKWCKKPMVEVNGEKQLIIINKKGFANIKREWTFGDSVYLTLPMNVEVDVNSEKALYYKDKKTFLRPNCENFDSVIDGIKDEGKPYATITYGPLLFAFTGDKESFFDYAFVLNIKNSNLKVKCNTTLDENFTIDRRIESPLAIKVVLQKIDFDFNSFKYSEMPAKYFNIDNKKQSQFNIVPYLYASKYRISMFPVAK